MTILHLTWAKLTSFLFRYWYFFFGKVKIFSKWSIKLILGAIITNPNLNKRHKNENKKEQCNLGVWEQRKTTLCSITYSKTFIKFCAWESNFCTGATSKTSLTSTFCELLTCIRYIRLCHPAGTKLFPCLFHTHSSGLGWFCIGINDRAQTNTAWYTVLKRCCFKESCVRGKFLSCQSYWAKSCYLHLFNSYLVDAAWYIKQTNLFKVFISLSITYAVGLLHSFAKLSVNCG